MFLYEQKDDSVVVHSLEPNSERIYSYKKEEIEKLSPEKRVFKSISNCSKPLESNACEISYSALNNRESGIWGGVYSNRFEACAMSGEIIKLLEYYYKLQTDPIGRLVTVRNAEFEDIKYLLLTETSYTRFMDDYHMCNIINLTRNLYLFENFIRHQLFSIDMFSPEELTRLLQLFDLKEGLSSVSLTELYKAYEYGVVESAKVVLNEKMKQSQKVLTNIRRNQ